MLVYFAKNIKTFKLDVTFECQQMYPELQSLVGDQTQAVLLLLSWKPGSAWPSGLHRARAVGTCICYCQSLLSHGCMPDQKIWIQALHLGLCNAVSRDRAPGSVSLLRGQDRLLSALCACSVSRGGCSFPTSVYMVVGGEFTAGPEDWVWCKLKVCNPSCGEALFEGQGEGRNRQAPLM